MGEAGTVFRIKTFDVNYLTLNKSQVDADCFTKQEILNEISAIAMPLLPAKQCWANNFKKLVDADRKMIETLNIHMSYINSDVFLNIDSLHDNQMISYDNWRTIRTELEVYFHSISDLCFGKILWDRTFLGNPFKDIITKLKLKNSDTIDPAILQTAFKKAYQTVSKAVKKATIIVTSFTQKLEDQRSKSKNVMMELDGLNEVLFREKSQEEVAKQLQKFMTSVDILSKSFHNLQKTKSMTIFEQKRTWIEHLNKLLTKIELAHEKLNTYLKGL